ncbi:MAG: His-Xaa-Ser system radical SAM maturase HxsB [Verrucomicrobiota bacterium]
MTPLLSSAFRARSDFASSGPYRLLPFQFLRLDDFRVLLTNLAGEFSVIETTDFDALCHGKIDKNGAIYPELLAKHILMEESDTVPLDLLNVKVQNRISSVPDFTGLHMFVVTLRCDHSCQYCQVSRQNADVGSFDMSEVHADKALEWMFKTPNQNVKIEFQGGESLLNFPMVKYLMAKATELNAEHGKNLQFVVATNLVYLTDEILEHAAKTGLLFSTSLDGPAELHNANRPRPGKNSFELAVAGINRIRSELGYDRVSALMTTTHRSLSQAREIVDTYLEYGFSGIFLRPLSPFGFATKTKLFTRYSQSDWLEFFEEGLDYIIKLNRAGIVIQEYYTSILLRKMLTPYGTGYIDLQNPSGGVLGGIIFNYDGKVFASDEGRMLAEAGNFTLEVGNLDSDTYESSITNKRLLDQLRDTMLECSPRCSDCAYQPWCGVDIAHHVATQGDLMGHKAFSSFCTRHMGMFKIILNRIGQDHFVRELFLRWAWK